MRCAIEIKESQIKTYEEKSLSQTLKSLRDGLYDVVIEKHKNKRSIQQNRYYWKVVIPFLIDVFNAFDRKTPMTPDVAHATFKDMAGWYTEDEEIFDIKTGTFIKRRVLRSLSNVGDISTVDFMVAINAVREAIITLTNGKCILPEPKKLQDNL